ncbi:MAG: glycosyltransferase family 2 protein, partial [Synergistaceae bacterium]|nr:glycosyltransferase family 2 protein [Synergistaceae bacterium]
NNGSQDNTPELCEELEAKYNAREFKIINLEPNQGINYARRAGVENASGEYIAFIDSDDYLEPETYETAIKILEENNCDAVQFGIKLVDLDGKLTDEWPRQDMTFNNSQEIYKYFLIDKTSPTWNVWDKVYKRSLFDEDITWLKISALEDYCMSAQIFAKANKLITINKFLYNYVQRPDSTGNLQKISKAKLDDIIMAHDLVMDLTGQKFPELLPEALAREMDAVGSFAIDFKPEVSQAIRRSYFNMRSTLKNCGIEFKIKNAANRKELIHVHFLAHYPRFYKFYLTTRLAIKKLTGI